MNETTVLSAAKREARDFVHFQRQHFIPRFHIVIDVIIDMTEYALAVAMGIAITILWASSNGAFDLRLGILLVAGLLYIGFALADRLFKLLVPRWTAWVEKMRRLQAEAAPRPAIDADLDSVL